MRRSHFERRTRPIADIKPLSLRRIIVSLGFSLLIVLVWLVGLATLSDLNGSDPAGNGLAQAFAGIEIIILWLLLAIFAIVAGIKGGIDTPVAIAVFILIPISGIAALGCLGLLTRPDVAPFLWPMAIPALVPPLIILFCLTALLPPLRLGFSARLANGGIWASVAVLCLLIWPMQHIRAGVEKQEARRIEKYNADLAALPADAPLWDWVPFLNTKSDIQRDEVLTRIRKLAHRQSDAETMIDRGDFPLGFVGSFDLKLTPALCEKARHLLRARAAPLVLTAPHSKHYTEIAASVADAVADMEWLVAYGCSCDAETQAWETMAKAYRDTNFDVVRLAQLRDPKELGRLLRAPPPQ